MEHITLVASQIGASYTSEFTISEIETPTQSLNPSSTALKAEYFLDEELSIKIGEVSPPNTVFSYNRNTNEDYTLWCRVVGPSDAAVDSLDVEILDYKPQFALVNYECKTLNEDTSLEIASIEYNELNVCTGSLDPQVQWKVYFKDVLQHTETIDFDPDNIDLDDLKLEYIFTNVGKYFIQCIVQNCNVAVTKSYELIVCGDVKFRKIDCSTLRIYNPKVITSINYNLKDLDDNTILSGIIPALSFIEVKIPEGIYKIVSGNYTMFVINWCVIESCYTDILKQFLCEDCSKDCKKCNENKDFEKKFTSIYNIYKKLVDTEEIYHILYTNVDIENKIVEMYSANELAKYLLSLCDCYNKNNKKCGC